MTQRLETERLLIRPFEAGDVEEIYRLVYADAEVRTPWSSYKGTLDEFRERFKNDWEGKTGLGYQAVVRKEDDALLGLMGYQDMTKDDLSWLVLPEDFPAVGSDPNRLDVELTYAFGKAYGGQGYATEAGKALIPYGFKKLNIGRIINAISPDNFRSRDLMIRLGFRFLDNGNPNDVIGVLENPAVSISK